MNKSHLFGAVCTFILSSLLVGVFLMPASVDALTDGVNEHSPYSETAKDIQHIAKNGVSRNRNPFGFIGEAIIFGLVLVGMFFYRCITEDKRLAKKFRKYLPILKQEFLELPDADSDIIKFCKRNQDRTGIDWLVLIPHLTSIAAGEEILQKLIRLNPDEERWAHTLDRNRKFAKYLPVLRKEFLELPDADSDLQEFCKRNKDRFAGYEIHYWLSRDVDVLQKLIRLNPDDTTLPRQLHSAQESAKRNAFIREGFSKQ